MSQAQVVIHGRQVNPTISIIAIEGDFSAAAEAALTAAYTQVNMPTTRVFILNCNGLTYMNSSGIGLLVTWLVRLNRQKQRLLCCGLSEHYRSIFYITRLAMSSRSMRQRARRSRRQAIKQDAGCWHEKQDSGRRTSLLQTDHFLY